MNKQIRLSAFFAAMLAGSVNPQPPKDTTYRPEAETSGRYNLPKWNVGDSVIFARDEKEAVKRAKKRGLWKEGMFVYKIG